MSVVQPTVEDIAQPIATGIFLDNARMVFDGSSVWVTTDSAAILSGDFSVEFTMIPYDANSATLYHMIGDFASSASRIYLLNGDMVVRIGGVVYTYTGFTFEDNKQYTVNFTRTGAIGTFTITDRLGNVTAESKTVTTSDFTWDTVGSRASGAEPFYGILSDVNINGSVAYIGHGNTDADWVDTIGSNNGTITGTPELTHI